MDSAFVGIACFALVFAGIVLVAQGSWRREPELFRGVWGPASARAGMEHRDEPHPGRLVAVGLALMAAGIVGAMAWSAALGG